MHQDSFVRIFPAIQILARGPKILTLTAMKFAMAIGVFVLFAFLISWGILLLLAGHPLLLICALLVFIGTFIKYGCLAK
jgi:hypothetical protein